MTDEDDAVPSNQFMIINGKDTAIIDPGGDLTFTPLLNQVFKYSKIDDIRFILGSHQDPDIIASMPRWLMHTPDAKLVIPKLWERFLPHFNSKFTSSRLEKDLSDIVIGIPDKGGVLTLGTCQIMAIPAHFLHSVGNFQFYDPISKILFSGDMGASLIGDSSMAVDSFTAHIPQVEGFHRRYMSGKVATKLWAEAIRNLPMDMMVPQHGLRYEGDTVIDQFLNWVSRLDCGVDLLTEQSYVAENTILA